MTTSTRENPPTGQTENCPADCQCDLCQSYACNAPSEPDHLIDPEKLCRLTEVLIPDEEEEERDT
jgi:hypothetical protein